MLERQIGSAKIRDNRAERRSHLRRIKSKMRNLGKRWLLTVISDKWVGRMASTHGKPCSCLACGNPRYAYGLTVQERRAFQDKLDDLITEDTDTQIKREVDALECDNPLCDCRAK